LPRSTGLAFLMMQRVTKKTKGAAFGVGAVAGNGNGATTIPTPTDEIQIRSKCNCGKVVIDVTVTVSLDDPNDNNDDDDDGTTTNTDAAINCHCEACRRYHTGPFASFLKANDSKIVVVKGKNKIEKYTSNCNELGPVERWFCGRCSSKLLSISKKGGLAAEDQFIISNNNNNNNTDGNEKDNGRNELENEEMEIGKSKKTKKKKKSKTKTETKTKTKTETETKSISTSKPHATCFVNLGPVVEKKRSPDIDSFLERAIGTNREQSSFGPQQRCLGARTPRTRRR